MVEITGSLSQAEITAFLEETTVPLRLACRTLNGNPWIVTLWFVYRDDEFFCATSAGAEVVKFVRSDSAVAFDVSTSDPPYRGVRGHGNASIKPDSDTQLLRELLERYLGGTDSPLVRRLRSSDREEVRIRVEPERLYGWDYAERMQGAVDE